MIVEIPIRGDLDNQIFQVDLENNTYTIQVMKNKRSKNSTISIFDYNREPILTGIPILPYVKLLRKYQDARLPPGEMMLVPVDYKKIGVIGEDAYLIYGTRYE